MADARVPQMRYMLFTATCAGIACGLTSYLSRGLFEDDRPTLGAALLCGFEGFAISIGMATSSSCFKWARENLKHLWNSYPMLRYGIWALANLLFLGILARTTYGRANEYKDLIGMQRRALEFPQACEDPRICEALRRNRCALAQDLKMTIEDFGFAVNGFSLPLYAKLKSIESDLCNREEMDFFAGLMQPLGL